MRNVLSILCAAALTAGLASAAQAQDYKDVTVPGTINIIVAYNAGGGTDILVRTALPYVEAAIEELSGSSTQMVVKNMPGAGGEVGWSALARAPKDGSTIGVINLPAIAIVEAAREPTYAPWVETFAPIGVNVIDPNVVRINDARFATLKDAIDAAKAEPGSVTVGADGPLSDDHLAVYAIEDATDARFTFIPYSGGAPANRAFLSQEVEMAMGNVTDLLQTEDATVEAAILAEERYELIPDVPTFKEMTGLDVRTGGSTRGWATVAGIPDDLLALYRKAFEMASNNPDYQAEAKTRKLTLVKPKVGDEFGKIMTDTQDSVQNLLKYFKQGGYLD
jgi:tripartite-type tricarboxylate transporter receptor subunit TctC